MRADLSPSPDVLFADGLAHHQAGRLAEAERRYAAALALAPGHAESLHLLGVLSSQTGRHDQAITLIGQALALNGEAAVFHFNLGNVLLALARLDQADACYRRALDLAPTLPEAHTNLGITLLKRGRVDEAEAGFRRALELRPDFPEAHTNLGLALKERGEFTAAAASHRRALELRPNYPEAHTNLGLALKELGELDQAVACHRRAIALAPAFADAHGNLSIALLSRGDWTAGWPEYEWRWRTPQLRNDQRGFAQPDWRGEAATGQTLLLHAEQGLGDTIQFCRFAPLAAARGLRVILEVQRPLLRLLGPLPGVDQVIGRGDPLPEFDWHCPLLSLPLALGTTPASLPAAIVPPPRPADIAAWRARFPSAPGRPFRLGIAWAGSPLHGRDRQRSMAPDRFARCFDLPGITVIALQPEAPAAALGPTVLNAGPSLGDFADTAALVAGLDLVISVDTALAHLAASLGVATWIPLDFAADWRWLRDRDDTPWYPTMRLFRQRRPGEWPAVVDAVRAELGLVLADHQPRGAETVPALFAAAHRHHHSGNLAEAEQAYSAVLALNSGHADSLHLLGVVASQTGRQDLAVELIERALAIDANAAAFHSNLGNVLQELRRLDQAEARYRRALALKPDFPEAHNNLGRALAELGRSDEAIECYRAAVALKPDHLRAHNNLGNALLRQGRLEEAEACLRAAIALDPAFAEAHCNLGNVLQQAERQDQAFAHWHQALRLKPDFPEALNSLGNGLQDQGRLDEAATCYRRAIALAPEHAESHWNHALALLRQGHYLPGWEEYEWGWRCQGRYQGAKPRFAEPEWRGESADGGTILLWAEQGLGDTIQFVRFAPLVARLGWRVVVAVPAPLKRLVATLPGMIVVAKGETLPAFDFHCPLLSLPRAFATTLATIPRQMPLLHPPAELVSAWKPRLAECRGLKIGIAWRGNPSHGRDRHRSMDPSLFAEFLDQPGLSVVSLQRDARPEDLAALGPEVLDAGPFLGDLADTAALIAGLDVVISVDTAICHLAGALAIPTWTLLDAAPDWRWMRDRADSPWYPTMRLFRQERPGEWRAVVDGVKQGIAALLSSRRGGATLEKPPIVP